MNSYKRCKHPQINSKLEEYLNPDYVYIPLPDNFNIQLTDEKKVMKNDILFEVSTFAGSRERAKQISDNWKVNADKIYPKIIDLLLSGE